MAEEERLKKANKPINLTDDAGPPVARGALDKYFHRQTADPKKIKSPPLQEEMLPPKKNKNHDEDTATVTTAATSLTGSTPLTVTRVRVWKSREIRRVMDVTWQT